MTQKRKRRSSVVEIGTGPARVKICTVNRKDGYPMFSLYWKEGGQLITTTTVRPPFIKKATCAGVIFVPEGAGSLAGS